MIDVRFVIAHSARIVCRTPTPYPPGKEQTARAVPLVGEGGIIEEIGEMF